jgi:hypothetical protein
MLPEIKIELESDYRSSMQQFVIDQSFETNLVSSNVFLTFQARLNKQTRTALTGRKQRNLQQSSGPVGLCSTRQVNSPLDLEIHLLSCFITCYYQTEPLHKAIASFLAEAITALVPLSIPAMPGAASLRGAGSSPPAHITQITEQHIGDLLNTVKGRYQTNHQTYPLFSCSPCVA